MDSRDPYRLRPWENDVAQRELELRTGSGTRPPGSRERRIIGAIVVVVALALVAYAVGSLLGLIGR